jgi:hypothetical protein
MRMNWTWMNWPEKSMERFGGGSYWSGSVSAGDRSIVKGEKHARNTRWISSRQDH